MAEETPTKKMNLAQALKYEKRVKQEITRVSREINDYNSVSVPAKYSEDGKVVPQGEPNRENVDVESLVERRANLKKHLVDLKLKMWEASHPIRRMILELAELKDDLAFWRSLPTSRGVKADPFGDRPMVHDAVYSREYVRSQEKALERQIDGKQASVDEFNHTTYVEVEDLDVG